MSDVTRETFIAAQEKVIKDYSADLFGSEPPRDAKVAPLSPDQFANVVRHAINAVGVELGLLPTASEHLAAIKDS